ncbi:hypothetical protein [Helicobacter sp. T3_23-1056]
MQKLLSYVEVTNANTKHFTRLIQSNRNIDSKMLVAHRLRSEI